MTHPDAPDGVPPSSADVVVVGCGPAGSAAATWLARSGREVTVLDAAEFPRDKTCGDGLTPRAMDEIDRLGLGDWVRGRMLIRGLELRGFGHTRRVPWPDGGFRPQASAVRRTVLDDRLRAHAVDAGARVYDGVRVTGVERDAAGAVTSVEAGGRRVPCRTLVLADGVRSPVGRLLGRTWHRDTVYAVAARSYVRSGRHGHPWIGSDLELRDADGTVQPGYGWVFPLGDGEVNLGVGALATARRPAAVAVKDLLRLYARTVTEDWELTGEPRAVASALLPMGGAVTGVAGPNWAAVGDAAACVNPLNGEGIDYALEGGRELAALLDAEPGADLTHRWPGRLRELYGRSFAVARDLAWLLTVPQTLPLAGPVGMRSQGLMTAAVRCMSNVVTDADRDLVARTWRLAGASALRLDRRPLFAVA